MIVRALLLHPLAGLAGIASCFVVLALAGESGDLAVGAAYVVPVLAAGGATARVAHVRGRRTAAATGWAVATATLIIAATLVLMLAVLVIGFMGETSS
jgi:hypothetical protein